MQEDKEPFFDAVDTVIISLRVLEILMNNTVFDSARMAASLRGDFSTATDLADFLVRKGLPFRQAHEVVGKLVARCEADRRGLEDLTATELTEASPLFKGQSAATLSSPKASADSRESHGGTGRNAIRSQLSEARANLSLP
jgi:argininosuccinate lyase